MARVFLPTSIRPLAGGRETVSVDGKNVRALIVELDGRWPGIKDHLCDGDELRPGLAVVVDGTVSDLGLLHRVDRDTEVHFLPALSGGEHPPHWPQSGVLAVPMSASGPASQ